MQLKKCTKRFRRWLLAKLVPDSDARMMLIMSRAGYKVKQAEYEKVCTKVVLDKKSYEFAQTADGRAKYDIVYGLTRQLADQLKDYVVYTEDYDADTNEWTCKVTLYVVRAKEGWKE